MQEDLSLENEWDKEVEAVLGVKNPNKVRINSEEEYMEALKKHVEAALQELAEQAKEEEKEEEEEEEEEEEGEEEEEEDEEEGEALLPEGGGKYGEEREEGKGGKEGEERQEGKGGKE